MRISYFIGLIFLLTFLFVNRLQAQSAAGLKSNIQVVTTMNRLFNEGKTDSAMLFFSDGMQGKPGERSPFRMMQQDIDSVFPGVQTSIQDIWADGDWVIARCLFSGSHEGTAKMPHHGGLFVGVPPTHKRFSVQHIRMYKVVGGKIVSRQAVRDDLGMYQQLGLLPAPPPFTFDAGVKPAGR